MIKKISTVALAALVCLPALASAGVDADRVADLEKRMKAMQSEIADLTKSQNVQTSKAVTTSDAADWTKKVTLGGEITFRGYNIQNVWDFDNGSDVDNRDMFRTKGSLWADFKPNDNITMRVKVTDQTYGEGVTYVSSAPINDTAMDNNSNKVFLDSAYVNVKNMFGLPVDGTFGRQNLIYGSGFVVLDGQSQFASTSIYFDGVKLSWHITDNIMLDGLYFKDQENTVDNRTHDDITLSGFYLTNKECPFTGMKQELYALNRNDQSLDKDIWMYGIRLSDKLTNGIDYSLEGAIQTGDATDTLDQKAYGVKLDGGYTFKDVAMTPRIFANYSYLSGDGDANDDDNEQWDVFYGGWPQFGDLLAWNYVNIGGTNSALNNVYGYNDYSSVIGEAAFSNLQMVTLGASANLTEKLSAKLSYTNVSFDDTYAGVDDDFGDYYQTTIKYQYTKNLSFSIYAALLDPGKAFTDNPTTPGMEDNATEVYWETHFKF